jgi:hypothetical protein
MKSKEQSPSWEPISRSAGQKFRFTGPEGYYRLHMCPS